MLLSRSVPNTAARHDARLSALSRAAVTAAGFGNWRLLQSLVQDGADPRVDADRPLVCAAAAGQLPTVRCLIECYCADVNARNGQVLIGAVESRRLDLVEYLLSVGADPCVRDQAPLRACCSFAPTGPKPFLMAVRLFEAGADFQAVTETGFGSEQPNRLRQFAQASERCLALGLTRFEVLEVFQNPTAMAALRRRLLDSAEAVRDVLVATRDSLCLSQRV